MLRRSRQKLGFTLVEILVVVMLVALLTTIGLVLWRGVDARAFNNRVLFAMTTYRDAFTLYAAQEKRFPSIPTSGSYCLKYGGLTGAEVNSRWPSASKPVNTTAGGVTEPSYFCRDFLETATSHASYPPLTRALESVSKINIPTESSQYLIDTYSGGIWARYSGTQAAATITIYGFFAGNTCPNGTTLDWSSPDGRKAICHMQILRTYPATYTGELWPYTT